MAVLALDRRRRLVAATRRMAKSPCLVAPGHPGSDGMPVPLRLSDRGGPSVTRKGFGDPDRIVYSPGPG